jgi:hypothetical protein
MGEQVSTGFVEFRKAFNDWSAGNKHTHENFAPDPTRYVGRVPAPVHRRAEGFMMSFIPFLVELVDDLHEDSDCSFDHHGDCQAHGWFGLEGSECPNATARRLCTEWRDGAP